MSDLFKFLDEYWSVPFLYLDPMAEKAIATKTTSVAIIGTAGRKEDAKKMSKELFEMMKAKAEAIILNDWKLNKGGVVLVSGGAPWADHVAVRLFNESVLGTDDPYAGLQLHLPCELKEAGDKTQAVDNGVWSWTVNPGGTVNSLHRTFSTAMGVKNTLTELVVAKSLGATFSVSTGFHARNALVSKADRIIAFTWGESSVKDGGTSHTWNLARSSHKKHVPLHTLAVRPTSTSSNTQTANIHADMPALETQ